MTTEAITMNQNAANDLIKRFQEDCNLRGLVSTRNYVIYVDEYAKFISKRGKSVLNVDKEDLEAFLIHLRKDKSSRRQLMLYLSIYVRSIHS